MSRDDGTELDYDSVVAILTGWIGLRVLLRWDDRELDPIRGTLVQGAAIHLPVGHGFEVVQHAADSSPWVVGVFILIRGAFRTALWHTVAGHGGLVIVQHNQRVALFPLDQPAEPICACR